MRSWIEQTVNDISQVLLEKETEIQLVLCCFLARGHLLIEDQPGVGKTTLAQCLSKVLDLQFSRIQFTSDLLPADIIGNSIFDQKQQSFIFHQGPLFASLVLGDELNRANPRTQSALLQALEEGEVSIDRVTKSLPHPFLFIATQNPRSQVGTFPLPESQLDRFLMSLHLSTVSTVTEIKIIQGQDPRRKMAELRPLISSKELIQYQTEVDDVHISSKLAGYITQLLESTRHPTFRGAPLSVRAGMALARAARSWAWMNKRDMVLPEDVQFLAPNILGHRLFPEQGILDGHKEIQALTRKVAVVAMA